MDPREAKLDRYALDPRHKLGAGILGGAEPETYSLRSKDYRTTVHDSLQLPARVRKGWDELALRASEPNPFFERWFITASDHLATAKASVRLAVVEDDQGLIGLLPLCRSRDYGRLLIGHVENWLHSNMFLGVPLIREGYEERFWSALIEALDNDRWARGFLHLRSITENGPVHRGLIAAAQSLGRKCPVVFRRDRPMLTMEMNRDAYLNGHLSKKRRSEYKRRKRRLAEEGKLEVRQLTEADELEPWCNAFLALEQASWKGEAGSAMQCCPDAARFFHRSIAAAFVAGRLHFLRLDLDGKPIAMLTSLLAEPGAFGFKSCFDQQYGRFSPGMLLQIENLEMRGHDEILWQDSCAMPGHPVGSLWSDERTVVHLTLPLSGWRRRLVHAGVRAIDEGCRKIGALKGSA